MIAVFKYTIANDLQFWKDKSLQQNIITFYRYLYKAYSTYSKVKQQNNITFYR